MSLYTFRPYIFIIVKDTEDVEDEKYKGFFNIRTILSRQCMDARQGGVYQDDIIPLVLYPGMAGAWMHARAGFIRTILLYPGRRMGNNIV